MKASVAVAIPPFLIRSSRIGTEEDTAWLQAGIKLGEHSRQVCAGDVKQGRVRKNAVEERFWQLHTQKVLVPDRALRMRSRHCTEFLATVQTNRVVASVSKVGKVAPRPASQVQNGQRCGILKGSKKCFDVLGNIVVTGTLPELLGPSGIAGDGGFRQVGRVVHEGGYRAEWVCAVEGGFVEAVGSATQEGLRPEEFPAGLGDVGGGDRG